MGLLSKVGITTPKPTQAATLFESLFEDKTFFDIEYQKPSEYVNKYWEKFQQTEQSALNGQMFELIISTLLIRENILPIYLQAKVAFVPNVNYDILLYSKECGPISLSLKTSLRERYKQADLEAIALKYVHRKAKCFLLTLEDHEAKRVKEKIKIGDAIGLDEVIVCSGIEIDNLVRQIKQYELSLAGNIEIITSGQIVTREKLL